MRRRCVLITVCSCVLAITACSGSDSKSVETLPPASDTQPSPTGSPTTGAATTAATSGDAGSADAPDACSLLTVDEIEQAAGASFDDPMPEAAQQTQYGTYTVCTWPQADSAFTYVRASVWDDEAAYADAKEQSTQVQPLEGIGDESFAASLGSVFASVDGHALFVQYFDSDQGDDENLAVSKELAQAAADRL